MFQKFGVMGDYFEQRGKPTKADLGRYLVTGEEDDKYVFKVPSLRNVALTAPYFHDASAATLEAAVDVMFRYQLGRGASKEDKTAIVAFLRTLTGETEPRS
jgi:cytochrome c peroxidase